MIGHFGAAHGGTGYIFEREGRGPLWFKRPPPPAALALMERTHGAQHPRTHPVAAPDEGHDLMAIAVEECLHACAAVMLWGSRTRIDSVTASPDGGEALIHDPPDASRVERLAVYKVGVRGAARYLTTHGRPLPDISARPDNDETRATAALSPITREEDRQACILAASLEELCYWDAYRHARDLARRGFLPGSAFAALYQ